MQNKGLSVVEPRGSLGRSRRSLHGKQGESWAGKEAGWGALQVQAEKQLCELSVTVSTSRQLWCLPALTLAPASEPVNSTMKSMSRGLGNKAAYSKARLTIAEQSGRQHAFLFSRKRR